MFIKKKYVSKLVSDIFALAASITKLENERDVAERALAREILKQELNAEFGKTANHAARTALDDLVEHLERSRVRFGCGCGNVQCVDRGTGALLKKLRETL